MVIVPDLQKVSTYKEIKYKRHKIICKLCIQSYHVFSYKWNEGSYNWLKYKMMEETTKTL